MTLADLIAAAERANTRSLAATWSEKDMSGWVYAADIWEAQEFIAACSPELIIALAKVAEAARSIVDGKAESISSPVGALHAAGIATGWLMDCEVLRPAITALNESLASAGKGAEE